MVVRGNIIVRGSQRIKRIQAELLAQGVDLTNVDKRADTLMYLKVRGCSVDTPRIRTLATEAGTLQPRCSLFPCHDTTRGVLQTSLYIFLVKRCLFLSAVCQPYIDRIDELYYKGTRLEETPPRELAPKRALAGPE